MTTELNEVRDKASELATEIEDLRDKHPGVFETNPFVRDLLNKALSIKTFCDHNQTPKAA